MSTVIPVLGLHRSGTSLVAGILAHLGVDMGKRFQPPDLANEKGYFEDLDFVDIHHRIIKHWNDPQSDFTPYASEYAWLVKAKLQRPLWGVKDPKMCFCFREFASLCAGHDVRVIIVRRPLEHIYRSLVSPNFVKSGPMPEPYKLCAKYQEALAASLGIFQGQTMVIHYDGLIASPMESVQKLANFVGLPINDQAVQHIDPLLRRSNKLLVISA